MTTTIHSLLPYVRATRRYGHTYVHANIRLAINGWQGIEGDLNGERVVATYGGYGRSLTTKRGHKYKAYLRYLASGKPVPSKLIPCIR